jgi:hypothetical protein
MEKTVKAGGEIIFSWLFMVFSIVDAIAILIGLLDSRITFSPSTYAYILIIGFIVSAVKVVVKKNDSLDRVNVLAIYHRLKNGRNNLLRIRNLGSEPVHDIEFEDINPVTGTAGKKRMFTSHFKIDGTNILAQNEERDIICSYDSTTNDNELLAMFMPKYATKNYTLIVSYKNSYGISHQTKFNLGKDGIKILS